MKRYIAAILVPCFLLQLSGCYSMQEISRDEVGQRSGQEDLQITTKDSKVILFPKDNYIVRSDSIIGNGNTVSNFDWIAETEFKGGVAFSDIETMLISELNITTTIIGSTLLSLIVIWLTIGVLYEAD